MPVKKNNVIFMAGHIMNFFNGVHYAKELVTQGKIGKVLYCHATRTGWEEQQSKVSWKKYVLNQAAIYIIIFTN